MESIVTFLAQLLRNVVLLIVLMIVSPGLIITALCKSTGLFILLPGQMLGLTIGIGLLMFLIVAIGYCCVEARNSGESWWNIFAWEILESWWFSLKFSTVTSAASIILFCFLFFGFGLGFKITWYVPEGAARLASAALMTLSSQTRTGNPPPKEEEVEVRRAIPVIPSGQRK